MLVLVQAGYMVSDAVCMIIAGSIYQFADNQHHQGVMPGAPAPPPPPPIAVSAARAQILARQADPRTTEQYDRASLGRSGQPGRPSAPRAMTAASMRSA
ncbi:MAG: hypothetical protein HHJ11_05620 [Phycicoccus sp.]|nr:hypothetical protein [Phycicoccus sp.]NMM35540.1 hypothetical protein [Phycicoccus sp.]